MPAQEPKQQEKKTVEEKDFNRDTLKSEELSPPKTESVNSSKDNNNDGVSDTNLPQNSFKEPTEQYLGKSNEISVEVKEDGDVSKPTEKSIDGADEITKRSKKKVYVVGIVITAIILATVGAVFYFRVKNTKENLENNLIAVVPNEEDSGDEVIEEQPSQKGSDNGDDQSGNAGLVVVQNEQLERGEISLEIFNGTDVVGLAAKTADTFQRLGYEITEIGNANDTSGNQLYVNPEFKGKVSVLMEDVEKEFDITSVSGDLTDSEASARIILGE